MFMPFPPLNPALERALVAQGYREPTPVQAAVLEDQAADKDLLVSAQTGSGKTVAYGLAFAPTLLGGAERFAGPGAPLALIVAPTRELAIQVARELTWLYAQTGAVVVSCVGGMDARREQRALAAGCHIVVGTPGRLRDHLERGHLDLSALAVVVLDEADEMLDLGFKEDLEVILEATPADRRTLLFSATIAKEIATLARQYQRAAVRIDTTSRNEPHGDIEYRAIRVAPNEVEHAVVNVLRYYEAPGALVFCSTREAVRHLYAALRERGFSAVALSGELTQKERSDALQALRDGHARVCVATDVAARGLDLPDLGLVIHAELPANRAGLLHRSGRTGRAGRKGISVLLVPYNRRRRVELLLASANIEAVWAGPPSAEEIRAGDQKRLLDDPILSEPPAEEDLVLARAVMQDRSAEEIATALIRLHRQRLPAPEELFDAGAEPERSERRPSPGRDRSNADRERTTPYHEGPSDTVWFRLAVGRNQNADPKWLVPLICRTGHVTKKDIGQIRIFDRETKFEIARDMEPRFTAAIAAAPQDKIRIEPAGPPGPKTGSFKAGGPKPERPPGDKPRRKPNDSGPADARPVHVAGPRKKPKPGRH
jgi:ATP-dependent RNA helicase DeaD